MATGDLQGQVVLLTSEGSLLTDFFAQRLNGYLLPMVTPSLGAAFVRSQGYPVDEAALAGDFWRHYGQGDRVRIAVHQGGSTADAAHISDWPVLTGLLALMLFAHSITSLTAVQPDAHHHLVCRLGGEVVLHRVVLPRLLCRQLLLGGVTVLGLAVLGLVWRIPLWSYYLPGLILYLLALLAQTLGLIAYRNSAQTSLFLLPLVLCASLGMMPMLIDVTTLIPQIKPLRLLLPPCWLFGLTQSNGTSLLLLTLGLSLATVLGYYAAKRRYNSF